MLTRGRCAIDAAGKATLFGAAIAALVSLVGAILARYGKRDDTLVERQRLAEERRQKDIDRIIDTLQEEVSSLRLVVKSHEETISQLRISNADLYGEKQMMSMEVARLRLRVGQLEGKIG